MFESEILFQRKTIFCLFQLAALRSLDRQNYENLKMRIQDSGTLYDEVKQKQKANFYFLA